MSWVIELRRADAVMQANLILAQHHGVLGVWRVTDASLHRHPADSGRTACTLTLVQQGVGRPSMLQLHDTSALVPVLVPLPEPEEWPNPGGVILRSGRLEVRLLPDE